MTRGTKLFLVGLGLFVLVAVTRIGDSNAASALSEPRPVGVPGGPHSAERLPRVMAAPRFSSAYTALTKCGSGMTRKEEKEAAEHGSDIPTRCKGFGGYDVYIYYSACSSHITLDRGEESIQLATQAVDWKQKTVEWRMAQVNGKAKPFAVIMRVYEYSGDDHCSAGGKIISESLMIKGLKGFEHINEEVKVQANTTHGWVLKFTPNPNAKARQIADKGYAGTKS